MIQILLHIQNRLNWHQDLGTFKNELEILTQQLIQHYQLALYNQPCDCKILPQGLNLIEENPFVKTNPGFLNLYQESEESQFIKANPGFFNVNEFEIQSNRVGYQPWSFVITHMGIANQKLLEWKYAEKNKLSLLELAERLKNPQYQAWSFVRDKLKNSNPELEFILQDPDRFDIQQYLIDSKEIGYQPWSFVKQSLRASDQEWYYVINENLNFTNYLESLKDPNYQPWTFIYTNKPILENTEEWFVLKNRDKFDFNDFLIKSRRNDYEPWSFVKENLGITETDPRYAEWEYVSSNPYLDFTKFLRKLQKRNYQPWSFVYNQESKKKSNNDRSEEWLHVLRNPDRYDIQQYLLKSSEEDYKPWTFVFENEMFKYGLLKGDPKYPEFRVISKYPDRYKIQQYLTIIQDPDYQPWSYVEQTLPKDDPRYKEFAYVFENRDKFNIVRYLRMSHKPDYKPWTFVMNNSKITPDDPKYKEWVTILSSPDEYAINEYLKLVFSEFYKPGMFLKKLKESQGWDFVKHSKRDKKYFKITSDAVTKMLEDPNFVEQVTKEMEEKYPGDVGWYEEYLKSKWLNPKVYQIIKKLFNVHTYVKRIPGEMKIVRYRQKEADPKLTWMNVNRNPEMFKKDAEGRWVFSGGKTYFLNKGVVQNVTESY